MTQKLRPNRVKEWIIKRSLSQSEVADKLGISTSYLSLISNGKRNPNMRLSTKLANILDADLLDVFPQSELTVLPDDLLDILMGSLSPSEPFEILGKTMRDHGYTVKLVQGEFELGYMASTHRPRLILLHIDMASSLPLQNLAHRLRMEPLTSHTAILPLINGQTGKRRRRQIEKIGLDFCEWEGSEVESVIAKVDRILKDETNASPYEGAA